MIQYYGQAIHGQLDLLGRRQKISKLLADPATPALLKAKLTKVREARNFAVQQLHLPDNGSYSCYADLERPFAVWNVFAAPEFSLKPIRFCFPIAGCVSYRGYFSRTGAQAFADKLRTQGHDVYVGGVAAYSTLGWFDDPVLNTMWPETRAVEIIFHELAHQRLYIANDSAFNEAFAVTVALEGIKRRQLAAGEPVDHYPLSRLRRKKAFVALVRETSEHLREIYQTPLDKNEMRTLKKAAFQAMRARYAELKVQWGGYSGYDVWFAKNLNNAKLATVSTYHNLVPAFQTLLAQCGGDLRAFYAAAKALGNRPAAERNFLDAGCQASGNH
ncbi:MAG: aminopeptidase [Gammaproteobacteria bacterium]|nr:aminopeptidase [Gammaproteobacteria bacterium]